MASLKSVKINVWFYRDVPEQVNIKHNKKIIVNSLSFTFFKLLTKNYYTIFPENRGNN